MVHDRAVTVALDVGCQALVWLTPGHKARHIGLFRVRPARETLKMCPEPRCLHRVLHIDEGIPESDPRVEVNGQIGKIVKASETLRVNQVHEHLSCVPQGQVPEHHGGALAWWCHHGRRGGSLGHWRHNNMWTLCCWRLHPGDPM